MAYKNHEVLIHRIDALKVAKRHLSIVEGNLIKAPTTLNLKVYQKAKADYQSTEEAYLKEVRKPSLLKWMKSTVRWQDHIQARLATVSAAAECHLICHDDDRA